MNNLPSPLQPESAALRSVGWWCWRKLPECEFAAASSVPYARQSRCVAASPTPAPCSSSAAHCWPAATTQNSTRRLLPPACLQAVVWQSRRLGQARTRRLVRVGPAVRVLGMDQRRDEDWPTSRKRMDPLPAAGSRLSESEVMRLVPAWKTGN